MTTERTVLEFFNATTREECRRHVYKYTDCGAWIDFHKDRVELGSIVEGCDFGTAIYSLHYKDGFKGEDIQARIDAIEAEADALWKWANEGPEDSEETWASIGECDPPDVWKDYEHLDPSGRSA